MKGPKIDDHYIYQTDDSGNSLLDLGFEVREKGTGRPGIVRTVHVNFPLTERYDDFVERFGVWNAALAEHYGEIAYPDDIKELMMKGPEAQVWSVQMFHVLRIKYFRHSMEDIFYDLLDPEVDDMNLEDSKEWLKANIRINHTFLMFLAVLDVDKWLKKNGIYVLGTRYQTQVQSPLSSMSPQKQEKLHKRYSRNQSSLHDLFLLETPSTMQN